MPFVVGAGRSGTTLLRLMLDAHDALAIPAETHFIPAVADIAGDPATRRRRFLQTLTGFETWPDLATSAAELDAALADVEPFTVADGVRCFYRLYASRRGKTRAGDKSPPYCLHLTSIDRLLPEAHFVHLIRDGRDVALSVRPLWFSPGTTIEAIAGDWARHVRIAREQSRSCAHYLEIRFEDLVRDTTAVLRRICDFLALPYQSRMERYFETARDRLDEVQTRRRADGSVVIGKTERIAMQRWTTEPPSPSRIGRWRREMSNDERRRFAAVAGDLLDELGYAG
jgi:hypothetical protein